MGDPYYEPSIMVHDRHNKMYTLNSDCIYSVYILMLELIVQKIYLLSSSINRPQAPILNAIQVIYRFEICFVLL